MNKRNLLIIRGGAIGGFFLFLMLMAPFALLATELANEEVTSLPKVTGKKVDTLVPLDEQVEKKTLQESVFHVLNESVEPGNLKRINWSVTLSSIKFNIPVIVAHGKFKGPVVAITAALHGDELNGIEIARQVMHGVDPERLAGTLVSVPIVNIEGFLKQSRYIADRRDLNRYFPGDPKGLTPARFAYGLFQNIILQSDALIDLHTGSYFRMNLPQLRADLTNDAVAKMVEKFGSITVLHSPGVSGMLRNAATAAGVPAVTMEVGGPLSLDKDDVKFGVKAVNTFLGELGMIGKNSFIFRVKNEQPIFYQSQWLMADSSGILLADVKLGEVIREEQKLAVIVNPMTNVEHTVLAPFSGTVLGMAQNQFVSPGYMIFRIGVQKTEEQLRVEAEQAKQAETELTSTHIDIIMDSEQDTQVPQM